LTLEIIPETILTVIAEAGEPAADSLDSFAQRVRVTNNLCGPFDQAASGQAEEELEGAPESDFI
jgi:hypothetical protein